MLAKLSTLSTWGGSAYPLVDSLLGLKASKSFIINTDNIVKYNVYNTSDSKVYYKLNYFDDRSPEFLLIVDETNAQIKTMADATAANHLMPLSVYEGALTFFDVSDIDSTTTRYFNVRNIVWAIEDETPTATMILVQEGGFGLQKYFVSQTLDKIIDIADTATTTTSSTSTSSTSSTSTSSTSTTSTSTTSTSSTSTSSTSTSSTS